MEPREKVREYRDEICTTLCEFIRIPSVASTPLEGMPFGEQSAKALQYILHAAQTMGFETVNHDNRAGHAEYGTGDDYVAVLVHVDVVPPGNGWNHPPFEGVLENGRIYGRGAIDDKGAAVAALYCLKALKETGTTGSKRVRVIFGSDEESGMRDIPYYFTKESLPVMAFTPDSEYPIYNVEKGLLHMEAHMGGLGKDSLIRWVKGGIAANVVPDQCAAVLRGDLQEEKLNQAVKDFANERITLRRLPSGDIEVYSVGLTAHAAHADLGFNACLNLVKFLNTLPEDETPLPLRLISDCLSLETDGNSFGVKCSDELSGSLTLNIGILELEEDKGKMSIDIRYPATKKGQELIDTIRGKLALYGGTIDINMHKEPLCISPDSELIRKLSKAYEKATGQKAELKAMGGATYARTLEGRGVSFGATFPDGVSTGVHQADEFVVIDELMRHCEISVEAMKELMK